MLVKKKKGNNLVLSLLPALIPKVKTRGTPYILKSPVSSLDFIYTGLHPESIDIHSTKQILHVQKPPQFQRLYIQMTSWVERYALRNARAMVIYANFLKINKIYLPSQTFRG